MKKVVLSVFCFTTFLYSDALPKNTEELLFQQCSVSKIKENMEYMSEDYSLPANIGPLLGRACATHDKLKTDLLQDIEAIWKEEQLPEVLSQAVLNDGGRGRAVFDEPGLISALFCLLSSGEIFLGTVDVVKHIVQKVAENNNYGVPINIVFFPFLIALQNPELRGFYTDFIDRMWQQLRENSSLAYGNNNMRIRLIRKISPILLGNDGLEGKTKMVVMLYVATCSELGLRIWENIIKNGKLPADFKISILDDLLKKDLGGEVRRLKLGQKQEKVQKAKDEVIKILRIIGVDAGDLMDRN
ncbi:MAG: hypothetical protein LBJ96_05150 [Holosporaceae bacterium]|nr:hypothetical protein [Holosporaceae bacterium]